MTIVDLFTAIYHKDASEVSRILTSHPEMLEQRFANEGDRHAMTRELYARCNQDGTLDNPHYKEENALLFAARLGRKDICEKLIALGADVNAVNTYGHNTLMSAFDSHTNDNFDTALMILARPDLNLKHTNYGKYDALGQLLRHLKYFGGDFELSVQKTQELIDALLDKKITDSETGKESLAFDLNKVQGNIGETAFLLACSSHSWIVVAYLISRGADYSVTNDRHYLTNMYSYLSFNQFLPPAAKEEVLGILEKVIKHTGEKYGPYKRPEHLYVDLDGTPTVFNEARYGSV